MIVTWILSVLPLALAWLSGGTLALPLAHQVGLVLLPWVFFAGLPGGPDGKQLRLPGILGVLLPPLLLALGIDLQRGVEIMELLPLLAAGLGAVLLLGLASSESRARDNPLPYHCAWWLAVPLPCVLLYVHFQGALPAASSAGDESLGFFGAWSFGLSPLVLIWGLTAGKAVSLAAWILAVFCSVALVALARRAPLRDFAGDPKE